MTKTLKWQGDSGYYNAPLPSGRYVIVRVHGKWSVSSELVKDGNHHREHVGFYPRLRDAKDAGQAHLNAKAAAVIKFDRWPEIDAFEAIEEALGLSNVEPLITRDGDTYTSIALTPEQAEQMVVDLEDAGSSAWAIELLTYEIEHVED